jgi:hypothetical protein
MQLSGGQYLCKSSQKGNHCSLGKSKSPIKNHNSNFNTSKGLQKYSTIPLTWNRYSKNPDNSAVEEIAHNSRSSGVGTFQYAY